MSEAPLAAGNVPAAPAAAAPAAAATPAPAAAAASAPAAESPDPAPAVAPAGGEAGSLATGSVAPTTPTTPANWPDDWRTKLAGDDKSALKQLERFTEPGQVFKSWREAQAKLSSGQLRAPMPAENVTPEEVATWRKENGLPEAPTGYIEKLALPNGVVPGEADKPILNSFAERAHKLGLPPDAFNGMVSQYYEMLDSQQAERSQADHSFKLQAQDSLNKEWGGEFRANINAVSNLLSQAPAEVKDRLFAGRTADGQIIGNDPAVLRWLAGLAREMNPMGALMPAGTSDALKSGEARIKEIEGTMRTNSGAYWKDAAMQDELRSLYEAREKMKARG